MNLVKTAWTYSSVWFSKYDSFQGGWAVVGITSFGVECARDDFPGTRVVDPDPFDKIVPDPDLFFKK